MAKKTMRGFTLLEIIIALMIFAVVMVLVAGGLSMVVRAQEQISTRNHRLAELQFAMLLVSHDLEQIVNRPVRDNNGALQDALLVMVKGADFPLVFTRGGVINPGAVYQRSTLQRVAYGLSGGQLIRYSWPVLDRTENTQALNRPILKGVTGFTVESLNERGELVSSANAQVGSRVAIVIHILLGAEGEIHRTFALPGGMSNAAL
ncbi:MAG: type II secretion system minor pseudopilin GspJ [Pseudomonadota bacterium]|nr:type II secretion system minor pseudopilin GspJ [Pseudomonadota bacterium]